MLAASPALAVGAAPPTIGGVDGGVDGGAVRTQ